MASGKESTRLRNERISGTQNGNTLRTRVVKDKSKYSRKIKHSNKSIAVAMDYFLSKIHITSCQETRNSLYFL